ncbi:VOC family protein [Pseudomonas sp. NPDC077186]|uniref:VOC family protein n=1 Tax=Pseudomonas sp. NPDC077186 TaxID=3364421 RepID=UPI0037C63183
MQLLLNLDVPDLAAAEAFYTHGLGLRVGRRLFAGSVIELLGAAVPFYLLHKAAGSAPCGRQGIVRDYGRHWTPLHLDVVVDDLDAALARALAAGARQEGAISEQQWGRLATLSDPFGHGLCLLQWRGDGYEQVRSLSGESDAND